jgi:hypothetical protein
MKEGMLRVSHGLSASRAVVGPTAEGQSVTVPDPAMSRWLRTLVPRSRHRAERARFAHNLAADYGQYLFEKQGGICAISGLGFSLVTFPNVLVKHPFAPSLDRISSRGGYTPDNVRLVCIAVNFGIGQWGEELYLTFARAAVSHSDDLRRRLDALALSTTAEDLSMSEDVKSSAWASLQRERIAAAEAIAGTLSGEPLLRQRRRIASLKRNLTLGPAGLHAAAAKALNARLRRSDDE